MSDKNRNDNMIQPIVETYRVDEEYLYMKSYMFIKGFAVGRNYKNMLRALPLARKMHNGQYRHGTVEVDGKQVKLPYILHCLKVCSTLISLNLPLSDEQLDILYTCALLHDTLEECSEYFPKGGEEYEIDYGFPSDVERIIKLLSKRSGATEYELNVYFNTIKKDELALLIKLADRSHNVEDLYNMKNIPKYINETKTYFINGQNSICSYGKANYPELSNGITILKTKILSLTEAMEVVMERRKNEIEEKDNRIKELEKQVELLKKR